MWEAVVEKEVRLLYQNLSSRWNRRDAEGIADLFEEEGSLVGLDGTSVDGRVPIREHLKALFANLAAPTYAAEVEDVRVVTAEVAVLRAVAGVVLPGEQADFSVLIVQTLVAARDHDRWSIALFHSSPAFGHEGPETVLASRPVPGLPRAAPAER
ncbi:MAG TPA: SgcJ/EcaC family oxidoreductase [Thermoanaerobaculia bacterium]|nr:SgcJ/EcaC family oxidoreductase [Thermoanaerobaculia bacterium]